jgi:hypothetical protein
MADGSLPVTRIEYLAAGACLFEAHGIASADREAVPVDDRIRRVVHGERVAHRARRDCPANVFMPVGSTCARSTAASGQNVSSEQAARARTKR